MEVISKKQMIKTKILYLCLLLIIAGLTSCDLGGDPPPDNVFGNAPIYLQKTNSDTITFLPPQPTINGGKIYLKGDLLFQVELYKGIHIVNIAEPENAQKIGFYEIFGCTQLTMQDQYMYANSAAAFIVVDISDLMSPRVVNYDPDYFQSVAFPPPPDAGYFECIDPSKGIVTGWERKSLTSPKCRY